MKYLKIIILLLVFCSFNSDEKEMTLRWGLSGEKGVMVVDETEILVIEWLEFVFYNDIEEFTTYIEDRNLKIKDLTLKEKTLLLIRKIEKELIPDTNVLKISPYKFLFNNSDNRILIEFRDGLNGSVCIPIDSIELNKIVELNKILLLPITGITYEQALKFIEWRNAVEKHRYKYIQSIYHNFEKYTEFYTFKLPSIEEHSLYNLNTDSIQYSKRNNYSKYNYKNSLKKDSIDYPYSKYGTEPLIPFFNLANNTLDSFKKNTYGGVKHVQGNVAEMSNIEGNAIGGSFFHYANQSLSTTINKYEKPEFWLGFRCIGIKYIKE